MKKMKNVLAIVVSLMLMAPTILVNAQDVSVLELIKDNNVHKIEVELQELDKDDEVRVIIELNVAPIIEDATSLGIHVDEMNDNDKKSKSKNLIAKQKKVIDQSKSTCEVFEVHEQFTNVVNGFSATVKSKDLEIIANNPDVLSIKRVNEYFRPEPQMVNSSIYTEAEFVNTTYGFTGEKMVVAVLDTGIDIYHQDMKIDDTDAEGNLIIPALLDTDITDLVAENGLAGAYYTEKVPYGYNYYDLNDYLKDDADGASMHGMHVSGTIAANGVIKGVAPNAQILAMRVFSNDPEFESTYSDIIIAAIDDAITLGADVMNLSLGSTAGYVDKDDPEQQAVTRAVENGIVMSISAGNSAYFGSGNPVLDIPFTSNPDIGVVGAPGITEEALSVASQTNYSLLYTSTLTNDVNGLDVVGYGKDIWDNLASELVLVPGYGEAADYDGLNVVGKIAVVSRGAIAFYDKTINAMDNGALGIVVFNNDPERSIYYNQGKWGIPFMLTDYEDGQELLAMFIAAEGEVLTGTATTVSEEVDPEAGQISSFSSYGTTSTLEFKPEITAPGGGIYSTFNDNSYGLMSGTSMAAPHVSGGALLLLEKINNDPDIIALNLTAYEKAMLCKNILMNTAIPIIEVATGLVDSTRIQGAGAMNLRNAIETDVVVTEYNSKSAKINLGEISDKGFTFDLSVQNYGGDTKTFRLSETLTTDGTAEVIENVLNANILQSIELDASVTYYLNGKKVNRTLVVNPYETVVLTVKFNRIDFRDITRAYENGYFVDGFIELLSLDEGVEGSGVTPLSIPLMAFYGDWSQADAFDATIYGDDIPFYGFTGLLNEQYSFLGYTNGDDYMSEEDDYAAYEFVAFSPNGDGYSDYVWPVFSLMRNLVNMTFAIEDENGQVVDVVETVDGLRKTWYDSGYGPSYHLYEEFLWDGVVNGEVVKDGQYYYVISGYLADGVTPKELSLPVKIDTQGPSITQVSFDQGTETIRVSADDFSGVNTYLLLQNGEIVDISSNGILSTAGLEGDVSELLIATIDHAENVSVAGINVSYISELVIEGDDEILLEKGESTELSVTAILSDGTSVDVTKDTVFTSSTNKVKVTDNVITARTKTSAIITATYGNMSDSIVVIVK